MPAFCFGTLSFFDANQLQNRIKMSENDIRQMVVCVWRRMMRRFRIVCAMRLMNRNRFDARWSARYYKNFFGIL